MADINNSTGNRSIMGTSEADVIVNIGNKVTINSADGNDRIYNNEGRYVVIYGSAGDDSIQNGLVYLSSGYSSLGENSTIVGGTGNDSITNIDSKNVMFLYRNGDGNDLIRGFNATSTLSISSDLRSTQKSGDDIIVTVGEGKITLQGAASLSSPKIVVELCTDEPDPEENPLLIVGTEGADSISNSLDSATIQALGGNDSISNEGGASVSIDGSAGDDYIRSGYNRNYGAHVSIDGGAGDDSIESRGEYVKIDGGTGNDDITNHWGSNATIDGGEGSDIINNAGSRSYLYGGDDNSKDSIFNFGSNSTILGGDGNDYLYNYEASNVSINGGNGDDSVSNTYGKNTTINTGAGDDSIRTDEGHNFTIDLGAGNDYIFNVNGNSVSIDGGDGDDSINNWGDNASINGGTGDDLISLSSDATGNVIQYSDGDGNDTVYGFNATSTLQIGDGDGTYSKETVDNDIVITVGDGSIILKYAASLTPNIDGEESVTVEPVDPLNIVGTEGDDSIINSLDGATIQALGGNDYVRNGGARVSVVAGTGSDSIFSWGNNSQIEGGAGDDSIYNGGRSSSISGGAGDDTIRNGQIINYPGGISDPHSATIDGGDGNDLLWNKVDNTNVSLSGGAGSDTIDNGGNNASINGGTGDDSISLSSDATGNVIQYSDGDGNDLIEGFNATTTLQIGDGDGTYSKATVDNDIVITVGDGSITLKDAASLDTLNIDGEESEPVNPLLIVGTEGNDIITNTLDGATIQALGGDDTIDNTGSNVSIDGGDNGDIIYNNAENTTIDAGAGNDSIGNHGGQHDGVDRRNSINAGDGDDTIDNHGGNSNTLIGGKGNDSIYNGNDDYTSISGGAGLDTIINFGAYSTVNGDGDDDIIYNDTENATVDAGAGNDSIGNHGGQHDGVDRRNSINAGDGDDTIDNHGGNSNTLIAGAGNDSIFNGNDDYTSISGGSGKDTISNLGAYVTIDGGAGDDYISNDNDEVNNHHASIAGGDGDDTIYNTGGNNATIYGGAGNDFIGNHGGQEEANILIDAGEGKDTIDNHVHDVTLRGGAGDDSIYNGDTATIEGGAGNDTIVSENFNGSAITINGGLDDDVISLYSDNTSNLIQYAPGDGNDTVYGFNANSTLKIGGGTGTYSKETVGNDIIVTVGDGSVLLKNAAQIDVNIAGKESATVEPVNPLLIIGTPDSDTINNSLDSATIQALASNDYIRNTGASVSVDAGTGNDTVENTGYGAWDYYAHKYAVVGSPDDATIIGGSGNDSLVNYGGKRVLIQGGNNNDYIANDEKPCDLPDLDTLTNEVIDPDDEDGKIEIVIRSAGDNLDANGYDAAPDYATLDGGTGHDTIYNVGSNVSVNAGKGNDSLYNYTGDNVTLDAGDGDDTLSNGKWNGDGGFNVLLAGGSGNDSMLNSGENATIDAGEGSDTVDNSGAQNVLIDAGAGDDSIYNSSFELWQDGDSYPQTPDNATIIAGKGDDTITNTGDNVLFTHEEGDGNDLIYGFNETSTLQIGDGTATYSTSVSGSDIIVTAGDDSITLAGAASLDNLNVLGTLPDSALNINNTLNNKLIIGTELDDTVTNSGRYVTISALAGNDSITNSGNYVSINASADYDTIINSGKYLTLDAGDGDDSINNSGQQALIDAKGGDDLIVNDGSGVSIISGAGNDSVINSANDVSIDAGDGKDSILTFGSNVSINGGKGNDFIKGTGGIDMAKWTGESVADTYKGGAADDYLDGESGNDTIDGGDGNDTLVGGKGTDSLIGGDGADIFLYNKENGDGNDAIADYQPEDIVSIVGGTVVVSTSGNNVILNVGNNKITLQGANDGRIITYHDDDGEHTYPEDPVVFSSDGKSASLKSTYSKDTFDIADYPDYASSVLTIDASAVQQDIAIIGNAKANSIAGGAGNDTITGGKANDKLLGGDGADMFVWNSGNGTDLIEDYQNEDVIKVNGTVTKVTTSKGTVILWIGSSKIISVKGADDEKHVVTYIDDEGRHTYPKVVDVDGTSVSLTASYIDDTFDVNTSPYVADDNPAKIKTIDASAVEHDLAITGNTLANKILGGEGNDTITGGSGNDTLKGNGGSDVFVYDAGNDTITDYNAAEGDVIQINGTVSKIAESGDDIVFTVGSKKITVKDGLSQLITYVDSSGEPKTYPEVPLVEISGKKITLTEYYPYETFDVADYGSKLTTIDASAVQHSVAITANSLANNITGTEDDDFIDAGAGKDKVFAGDGNDTIVAGKGNDTLSGGDGENVFVFESGDGNNVITDYKSGEIISIPAGASVSWTASDSGDVFMKIGTTNVTVQGAAGKYIHVVDDDGAESWYPNEPPVPVEYDAETKTAVLTEGYFSDTFLISDYSDISADIDNIDASAVTHDMSIVADSNKNNIVGSSQNDFINGVAGNDTILGGEGDDSIQGGKGTDNLTGGDGADVFIYNSGDGNDIIQDYTEDDVIQINGASVTKVTKNAAGLVTLYIGSSKISVKGGASHVITYVDSEGTHTYPKDVIEFNSKGATLSADYIAPTFDVNTNPLVADYATEIKTIDASEVESDIAITGNTLANNIKGGKGSDTLTGGTGNDSLAGGEGDDVFYYTNGDGNDTITDYEDNDSIIVDGEVSSVSTTAKGNVILTIGKGRIVVADGEDHIVTYTDVNGTHSCPDVKPVVIEGKVVSLTENYSADTFDVADHGSALQTIDASAVEHDIKITANKLANKVIGGKGNDTLLGGTGNDSLTGGDGDDVFYYTSGDGNDTITDYQDNDSIFVDGEVSSVSTTAKGNVILTIGKGRIVVADGEDKSITYTDANGTHVYPDIKPYVIDGKVITLTENYADETFDIADYGSKLQTIDASAVQHSIAITANSLANSIVGTEEDDFIEGGKGADKIKGGGGADVFIYNSGDGNDTIQDYSEEDVIHIASGTPKFAKSGENVIMTVGSNKVTLTGAADKIITYLKGEETEYSYYPKKPVSVSGTTVTLLEVYSADTFDLATNKYIDDDDRDAIKTINAAAVEHDIAITGNKQANKITGGAGNNTLIGGKGNDNLTGGEGADVFVYNTGDGNDVITDYTEEDRLHFADTTIDTMNVSVSGADVVFAVGKGKVTVKGAADKVIAYSDETTDTSYPEVIRFSEDYKTATLLAAYKKDTFDVADYPNHADKVQTINASAVKFEEDRTLTIVANANKNTIVGSSNNDNINGAAGQDMIYGGEGNDTLIGGTGNDTLYGGEGADTFVYKKGDGNDVIADYQEAEAIRITGITGVNCYNSGDDVIIKLGTNTITIRNANTAENAFTPITYYDGIEGTQSHSYIPAVDGSSDLLIDDNYSATAALSAIVEPVKANYTPYDFEGDFDLVKQPAFAPAPAYSDKK